MSFNLFCQNEFKRQKNIDSFIKDLREEGYEEKLNLVSLRTQLVESGQHWREVGDGAVILNAHGFELSDDIYKELIKNGQDAVSKSLAMVEANREKEQRPSL